MLCPILFSNLRKKRKKEKKMLRVTLYSDVNEYNFN